MSLATRVLLCLLFLITISSVAAAGHFTPGDVVVTPWGLTSVMEYTPAGSLVQSLTVPHPEFYPDPRGVVVDIWGRLHVYNNPFETYLSTYDPVPGTWTHHSYPGWSSYNCYPCDALGAYQNYVFATDEAAYPAQQSGIVRFDTSDWSAQRFASGQDYSDLTVGLDGLVYARRADAVDPPPPTTIDVFDPGAMQLLRSVTLENRTLTLAVGSSGHMFGPYAQGILEFDAAGHLIANYPLGVSGYLYDIDMRSDGSVVASSSSGEVVVTSPSLAPMGSFRIITGSFSYVTFVPEMATPVRASSWGRLKALYR
jgi:hypothetical protein